MSQKKFQKNSLSLYFYLYLIILIQLSLYKQISSAITCHTRCRRCAERSDYDDQNCAECRTIDNYYFIRDISYNCYTREEAAEKGAYYVNIGTNQFEECHEACYNCSDGNTPTDLNNRCFFCKEGYYKKDSKNSYNCYKPYDIEYNYYKDESENPPLFKQCYERCNTCSQSGTSDEHNCDSCKVGTNSENQYYKLDSEETGNCYLLEEIEENYEIPLRSELNSFATQKINERNEINSPTSPFYSYVYELIARQCYKNCKTCTRYGTEENMNCITCREGYFFYKNNCYKKCPKPDTYQLKDSNYQCKELVEGYKIVTDYKTSNDIVDFLLLHGLGEFDFAKDLITANKIYGQIYSWKNKETNDNLADKLKLSKISISDSCFNKIIKFYNLTSDIKEDLILIKFDRNYSDTRSRYRSSVNQIDFYLFYPSYEYDIISGEKILNGTYTEISISTICTGNEDEIKIIKPLINLDESVTGVNLSEAKKIHNEYNLYDMYLANNIFFSDICSTFKSNKSWDVELDERRDKYYQNISFCEGNCVLEGLDYDSISVTCDCDATELLTSEQYKNVNFKDRRNRIKNLTFSTLANRFPENSSDSYIKLNGKTMTCKHLIYDLDIAIENFGNWFAVVLFLAKMVIFYYFIREKFKPINEEYNKRKEKIEIEILQQIPDAKLLFLPDLEKIPKYHIEKEIWSNYAGAFKYDKNKKKKNYKYKDDGEANKFTYNGLLMNKNRVEIVNNQTEADNKEKKTAANPPKRLGYVFNDNDERQKENDEGHLNNRNNVFQKALKDLNYNTKKIKDTKSFFKKEENKTSFFNAIYPINKEIPNELNTSKNNLEKENEKENKLGNNLENNKENNKENNLKKENNNNKEKGSKKRKKKLSFVNAEKMDQMVNDLMPPDYDKVEVNLNDKIPPLRNQNLKFNPAKLNQVINEENDFKKDQKARREFNENKAIQEENRKHKIKQKEKNHNRENETEKEKMEKKSEKKKKLKKKKFGNQNYMEDPDEVAKYKKAYLDDDDLADTNAFKIEPAINYRFCSMVSPEKLFFMKYNYAVDLDRRTFMEIYMGCVKMSQLIMNFIYVPYYHNMKFLKIYFMIFVANLNILTTTAFYSHYHIGTMYGYKVFMCILQSFFVSIMLFLFSFSKKKFTSVHVLDIWKLRYYKKLYIFIVIASIIFEFGFSAFIWFWSSAFCAVFRNSYHFYFLHILESIIITLGLPFLFSFLPAFLRYLSLVYEKKLLYQINYFVDMFF